MKQNELLAHIIEIKESIAKLEGLPARVAAVEEKASRVETTLKTVWAFVVAIPTIAAVLAFFGIPHMGANHAQEIHR